MKELLPLTPEQLAIAEARFLNPAPGSAIERAREYGIDLTLILEQLRLTPAERVRRMHDAAQAMEAVRGAARRKSG